MAIGQKRRVEAILDKLELKDGGTDQGRGLCIFFDSCENVRRCDGYGNVKTRGSFPKRSKKVAYINCQSYRGLPQ